jgi:DNA-binding NtrC family response regulator/tetratricopeptide (TPR) repeat protein
MAGPGPSRARFLTLCTGREELEALLASPTARALWDDEAAASSPPVDPLVAARSLLIRGRFSRALVVLAGLRAPAATVLRLRCRLQLGELGAVRDGLRRLATAALSPAEVLEAAEVAVRAFANGGEPERATQWVERALTAVAGVAALAARADLLAAEAAWDRGEPLAVAEHLAAARPALADPALAWRWYQVRGLEAMAAGDGDTLRASLGQALAGSRRHLSRPAAAGLWNDLGIGRVQVGDLRGAERAFRHAVRLLGSCDGPRRTTLALSNLAEVRLRRGELAGVREILEQSTAENRLAGNLRGLTQDNELWARFEMVLGRPGAALTLCREALRQLDAAGLDWRQAELRTLAARALGWLERPEEAAAELQRTTAASRAELEPEEQPALWALAGNRDTALREAAGTPFAPLWRAALTGEPPEPAAWEALEELEPYRAARLIFDLTNVAPEIVPAERRRAAIAALRATGAGLLAERLSARAEGPWEAVAQYLAEPTTPPGGNPQALGALLSAAGYPEASLTLEIGTGCQILLAGPGGEAELAAEHGSGRLILRAPATDAVLRALFALLRRTLPAPLTPLASEEGPPPVRSVGSGGLVGESPALHAALDRLARLASRDLTLLVQGETGTGKELAARLAHRLSPRGQGPFVAVNCAALSESLLLSDLFGHVRGAFTGADRDRAGVFETAQRGTVFLDEIGDLPAVAQGMLLRVLQEGEVRRVGESLPRRVDVRVIAATHRDLAAAVPAGTFREDLFYRLKVGSIELPPLRERGSDIIFLADHFLSRQRSPGFNPSLSREARERLLAHDFPGNVRELQNVLAVAAALASGGTIGPEHLGLAEPVAPRPEGAGYHHQVEAFRRQLVRDALLAGGNQSEAARRLGLSRQALSYLVRQLRLL